MQHHDITRFFENTYRPYTRWTKVRYAGHNSKFESPAVCGTPNRTTSAAGSQHHSLAGVTTMQPENCRVRPESVQRKASDNPDRRECCGTLRRRIQASAMLRALKTKRGVAAITPLHPVNAFLTRGPPLPEVTHPLPPNL